MPLIVPVRASNTSSDDMYNFLVTCSKGSQGREADSNNE